MRAFLPCLCGRRLPSSRPYVLGLAGPIIPNLVTETERLAAQLGEAEKGAMAETGRRLSEKGGVSRRVTSLPEPPEGAIRHDSHTTVVPLRRPDEIEDPLTAVLRSGARRLLAQAIEAEAEAFLATMKGVPLSDGRERLVRHGHLCGAVQALDPGADSAGLAVEGDPCGSVDAWMWQRRGRPDWRHLQRVRQITCRIRQLGTQVRPASRLPTLPGAWVSLTLCRWALRHGHTTRQPNGQAPWRPVEP